MKASWAKKGRKKVCLPLNLLSALEPGRVEMHRTGVRPCHLPRSMASGWGGRVMFSWPPRSSYEMEVGNITLLSHRELRGSNEEKEGGRVH